MTSLGLVTNRRRTLGQLIFCMGCCCGRVDRGKPELPVERLKSIWKHEQLNASIQLTISGCLGPCDLCNVVVIVRPNRITWLGGLTRPEQYELLIDWARACHHCKQLQPLPELLMLHEFERFSRQAPEPKPQPAIQSPAGSDDPNHLHASEIAR